MARLRTAFTLIELFVVIAVIVLFRSRMCMPPGAKRFLPYQSLALVLQVTRLGLPSDRRVTKLSADARSTDDIGQYDFGEVSRR